ncbi:MAG: HAMP domain-containing protein [Treponema sp.]|nr:HAMP domain-containing protein [Treponema sp.]
MKGSIWSKILLFAIVPFLVVYIFLAVFILRFIYNDKLKDLERDVRNLARFNKESFHGFIDNSRLSVMIAATELGLIDTSLPGARTQGERLLVSSFSNRAVYNSWLVFEPNAFDGRDDEHRGEYPGERSGRYMRSYVRQDSSYVEAPDMDENLLDNMDESYWYLVPKLTGKPFIDINISYELYWDYAIGEGPVNSISLAAPVTRNGEVIGCVGEDIILTDIILGPELIPGAISALISPNGALRYYRDHDVLGKTLEELGFSGAKEFMEASAQGKEFFLSGEYNPLVQAPVISFYTPVVLEDFGETLYVYAAIPESIIREAVNPLLMSIAYSLIFVLAIFAVSLLYLVKGISKPIHDLVLACEAISQGNFDTVIVQSRSRGEIGIMTQSLYRMVEQFKIYIAMQEQSRELLNIYTRLYNALYQYDRLEDVFDEIIPLISDYFKVHRASLVFVSGEDARLLSSYDRGTGPRKEGMENFAFHHQVVALLAKRKYISLNFSAMQEQKIDFAGEDTRSLCILPFLVLGKLRAYVIMEGDSRTGPLVHGDEALLFISQTVSYVLAQREAVGKQEAVPESGAASTEAGKEMEMTIAEGKAGPGEESPVLKAARIIEGLDVDKGLFHSGSSAGQYEDLLRISAKSFEGKIEKMRSLYLADLPAFGIEIHGIKGALYSIGAAVLGDEAKALEFAAKAGEASRCAQDYPVFEKKLAAFAGRLAAISRQRERPVRGPGDISALIAALKEALEASRLFDSDKVAGLVNSLLEYSWDESRPEITGSLEKIADALECMDYDAVEQSIGLLLESLA